MAKEKTNQPAEIIVAYEYKQEDLATAMAEIGRLQIEIINSESEANERIQQIQLDLANTIKPMKKEIKKISLSINLFADANREKLFKGGDKTTKLVTGDISYRFAPPSVDEKSSKKLIDTILEQNNLVDVRNKFVKKMEKVFIRTKLELNKESILGNPDTAKTVTGVEVAKGKECFYVKPYATNTEIEVTA